MSCHLDRSFGTRHSDHHRETGPRTDRQLFARLPPGCADLALRSAAS